MALSGSTGKQYTPKGAYWVWVEWSGTQNIANNTTTITAITYAGTNSYGYYGSSANGGNTTINGQTTVGGSTGATSANTAKKEICRRTEVVSHNADGTKSVTISGRWWAGTIFDLTSSGTFTLDTIPRTSSASLSSSSINLGDTITVNISRASTSFTHHIYEDFFAGTWKHVTTNGAVGTSGTVTIPLSYASRIPNQTSGGGRILVETYSGSTYIGGVILNFTASVPSSVKPSASLSVSGVDLYLSQYVQGKSKINVTVNSTLAYGSPIVSRSTVVKSGTTTLSSSASTAFTTGVIANSGPISISTTITDSRGRTGTATSTVNMTPYAAPAITGFNAFRSNADGSPNPEGEFIKITGSSSISPINNTNTRETTLRYRIKGASVWQNPISNKLSYTPSLSTVVPAPKSNSYEVQVYAADYFTHSTSGTNIGTAFVLLDFHSSGTGMAIGKVAEYDNAFEVYLRSNILKFNSIHSHDWTTAGPMQGKTYLGGWHGPLSAGVSKGYMAIGAVTAEQSIDFMIDGDMFVREGANKVWNNTNCQVLTNANGVAYKFENGLMITVQRHSIFAPIANAWGTWFASGQILVPDYPAAFMEVPTTTITASGAGATVITGKHHTPAPTIYNAGGVEAFRGTTSGALTITFSITAIGRWK